MDVSKKHEAILNELNKKNYAITDKGYFINDDEKRDAHIYLEDEIRASKYYWNLLSY